MKQLCTFLKQNGVISLQFIEPNNESIGMIKSTILLDSTDIGRIQSEIESYFNVHLSDSQKYCIQNNNKGVLNFQ